jgi:hypothetical protein
MHRAQTYNTLMERDVMESSHRAVVYLDLLGFASLTEAASPPTFASPWTRATSGESNPATLLLSEFHKVLDIAVADEQPNHAIIFSDCAFVVFYTPHACSDFSAKLMRQFLQYRVPVRMGLGYGTFETPSVNSAFQRSSTIVRAIFGGTSVVRAVGAEKCGAKGMRIFAHESIADCFMRLPNNEMLPRLLLLPNAFTNVSSELDYVCGADAETMTRVTEGIRSMSRASPAAAQLHYSETINALDRMRSL